MELTIPGVEEFGDRILDAAVGDRLADLAAIRDQLQESLKAANERQALQYNRRHRPTTFKPKQQVLVSTKNIRTWRTDKKLSQKHDGPFEVVDPVRRQASRLG